MCKEHDKVMVEVTDRIVQSSTYTWDATNRHLHGIVMEYYWLNNEMLHLDRANYPHCELSLKQDADQRRSFRQPTRLTPNDNIGLLNSVKKFFNDIFIKWLY